MQGQAPALGCRLEARPASAAEVDAALAALGDGPGIYFGCDAGVAGLHPLQATLVDAPALAIRVHVDGAELVALDDFGAALLAHPALAGVHRAAGRGPQRSALPVLRALLATFATGASGASDAVAEGDGSADAATQRGGAASGDPLDHALLIGALRFDAHRLGTPRELGDAGGSPPRSRYADSLGTLFFAPSLWRRGADARWRHITLRFDDAALETLRARSGGRARAAIVTAPAAGPAGAAISATSASGSVATPHDDFMPGGYAAMVGRAVERLAQPPLVSLTLSQSFRRALGDASPLHAFAALRAANPAPATFCFDTGAGELVFGASPDLQLVVNGRSLESFPVCGSVPRGHGPVGEAEALRRLFDEAVDAASLAVCTDALRNDLAPLCEPGSLRLLDRRRPLTLATVVHTVDRLCGRLAAGHDAWDAIVATAAPVMVTGTPRAFALQAIAAFEASPRSWYGGLVVQVSASGDALVGTILRAATIRDGIAEVRTGGDLLVDSDPVREEHESRFKAVSLWRALGLPVPPALDATLAGAAPASGDALVSAGARLPRAVALCDAGDPFAAAVAECLRGFGLALDNRARPVVLIGADAAACARAVATTAGLVALGDAAARVLQADGFDVAAIAPAHGRLLECRPEPGGPGAASRAFVAMRYATLEVRGPAQAPAGWSVWLRDGEGRPVGLAHAARCTVCLAMRPESLLSDALAREWLRAGLAFAAG